MCFFFFDLVVETNDEEDVVDNDDNDDIKQEDPSDGAIGEEEKESSFTAHFSLCGLFVRDNNRLKECPALLQKPLWPCNNISVFNRGHKFVTRFSMIVVEKQFRLSLPFFEN